MERNLNLKIKRRLLPVSIQFLSILQSYNLKILNLTKKNYNQSIDFLISGYIDDATIFYDSDSSMVMKLKDFGDQDRFPISNKESGPAANMITGSKRGRNLGFMEDHQNPITVTSAYRMFASPDYGRASRKTNTYDNVAILVNNKDRSSQQTKYPTTLLDEDQKYIYPIHSENLVHYLPKDVPITQLEKMKQLASPTVFKNENEIHILMHIPLPNKGYSTAYKNPIDGREPTSILNVIKIERVPKY